MPDLKLTREIIRHQTGYAFLRTCLWASFFVTVFASIIFGLAGGFLIWISGEEYRILAVVAAVAFPILIAFAGALRLTSGMAMIDLADSLLHINQQQAESIRLLREVSSKISPHPPR